MEGVPDRKEPKSIVVGERALAGNRIKDERLVEDHADKAL